MEKEEKVVGGNESARSVFYKTPLLQTAILLDETAMAAYLQL